MVWLAQTISRQTLSTPDEMDAQLVAMAADPEIQRELAAIEAEFTGTKTDGLRRIE